MPTLYYYILRYTSLAIAFTSIPLPILDIGSSICRFNSRQTIITIVLLPCFIISSLITKSIKICRYS
jgi:hypothetical protein